MSNAVSKHRLGVFALVATALLVGLATFSSLAQAACDYPDAEQVFAPWNDQGYYQLAPEGSFEAGASGWTLRNGAALVTDEGTRPHEGAQEATAVELPYGASATSPPVCVDESTPSFRVLVDNVGEEGDRLRVVVSYERQPLLKGRVSDVQSDPEAGWVPSQSLKLGTEHEGERVARITLVGKDPGGVYRVDDLYVDPFARW
jgi:hypothetical protein